MLITSELFILGVAMGLAGAALFGLSNVVYKSQSAEIHPIAINAFKMWITIPVIFIVVLVTLFPTGFNVPPISIPFLISSIILGAGIGDLVYLTSQARIGVSRAFPIAMTFPLITYFFSVVFLLEPILITRLIGAILAILGLSLITREQAMPQKDEQSKRNPSSKRNWDRVGVVLAFLAALAWAGATVILQVGLIGADPIDANLIRILAGAVFLLPVFLIARQRGMSLPTRRATKLTIIAGFFGMGIGSILYVNAVYFTGAAVTSVISSTAPLFALPFAIFYLKEKVTPVILLGTLLTIIGVWLVVLGF
ncbi:MAG: DMT family transporter [Candidatus Thorarchaeota archaeon]